MYMVMNKLLSTNPFVGSKSDDYFTELNCIIWLPPNAGVE